jgi:hypothetical protein
MRQPSENGTAHPLIFCIKLAAPVVGCHEEGSQKRVAKIIHKLCNNIITYPIFYSFKNTPFINKLNFLIKNR